MRNLKRALSLVLAAMMLIGMMVVGASAASFPDSEKIEHTEAVNSMVALGIIKGKDNGNFDPEGNVTRAEMAKMICVAMNGGKDPNLTGVAPYSDTEGHWAAGYIQWCTNLRYVSGYNGMFRPDDTVTGTEAAKMLLVALGYNAQQEKYENDANWAGNINVAASLKGLYEDLPVLPDAPLTRDSAAQMVWNAVNATMVQYEFQGFIVDGTSITVPVDKTKNGNDVTILTEKFDLKTGYGYMTGVKYDSKKDEYTYTFDNDEFGTTITKDVVTGNLTSANDYSDLFGVKTKILYKDNSDKTVYGMYADGTVVYEGTGSKVDVASDNKSVKLDGTKYDLDNGAVTAAYNAGKDQTAFNLKGNGGWYAVKAIDNDNDGEVDVITYVPTTVVKVTFVGKDNITAGNVSYEIKKVDLYEDVAKNDYAVITDADNTKNDTTVIAKAEVITDTIQATRSGEAKVDGTWYKVAPNVTAPKVGDEMDLVVLNGYIFHGTVKEESAKVENAVYTLLADPVGTGTKAGTQTVKLLFADGSKKIVTVDKVNNTAGGELAAPKDDSDNSKDNLVTPSTLYTYKTDKDGNYELSLINAADFDKKSAVPLSSTAIADGKFTVSRSTYRFADDAVVFVTAGNDVKVVPAATINDWAPYTASTGTAYINTKDGFNYVALGAITLTGVSEVPGVKGDTSYGWITGTPSLVKDGDDYFIEVSIWNGSEDVTALVEGTGAGNSGITSNTAVGSDVNVKKGTPVSYKDLGDNHVDTVTALTSAAAVTAYAGGADIGLLFANGDTGTYEIDDDTAILYVNTKDNKGVEGGSIEIAQEDALGNYVKNVYAGTSGGKVTYLIVDTGNNLAENKDITFTAGWNTAKKEYTFTSGDKVSAVEAAAKALVGCADANVIAANGDEIENKGSTAAAAGQKIVLTALDGSVYYYTVVAP